MSRRKRGNAIHGWIALDKPIDMTSTQAVAAVRRLFDANKAGHAGTLDPLASGILPIALGEATKTVPWLMEAEKGYRFRISWGVSTNSQDREGEVTARSDLRPDGAAIAAALAGFVGEISQVPPQFSAIKVNGERAYDIARAGETVELQAREVHLKSARLIEAEKDSALLEILCGKGFYVRSLVRDLAISLGAEGHVAELRRTKVGPFTEESSCTLDALAESVHKGDACERLYPIETALADIPALAITGEDAFKLKQGRAIVLLPHIVEGLRGKFHPRTIAGQDASRAVVAFHDGLAIALGDVRAGAFKPHRVFQQF